MVLPWFLLGVLSAYAHIESNQYTPPEYGPEHAKDWDVYLDFVRDVTKNTTNDPLVCDPKVCDQIAVRWSEKYLKNEVPVIPRRSGYDSTREGARMQVQDAVHQLSYLQTYYAEQALKAGKPDEAARRELSSLVVSQIMKTNDLAAYSDSLSNEQRAWHILVPNLRYLDEPSQKVAKRYLDLDEEVRTWTDVVHREFAFDSNGYHRREPKIRVREAMQALEDDMLDDTKPIRSINLKDLPSESVPSVTLARQLAIRLKTWRKQSLQAYRVQLVAKSDIP